MVLVVNHLFFQSSCKFRDRFSSQVQGSFILVSY